MTEQSLSIQQACENLGRYVGLFEADRTSMGNLERAMATLGYLRQEYRLSKNIVEPHLPQIQGLSQRLQQAIRTSQQELVTQYFKAGNAIAAWQQVRDACRDALCELAQVDKLQQFACDLGTITARPTQIATIPKPDTPERQELMQLLMQSGRWADVCVPNGVRLVGAIERGLLTPELVQRVTRLCSLQTVVRLHGRQG